MKASDLVLNDVVKHSFADVACIRYRQTHINVCSCIPIWTLGIVCIVEKQAITIQGIAYLVGLADGNLCCRDDLVCSS